MNLQRAYEILGDDIKPDGLDCLGRYLWWRRGSETATLDADFTADELEAIAFCMRNM